MSKVPNNPDLYDSGHPVINAAIEAITASVIPVSEISRAEASQRLIRWAHAGSLTARETDAILNRFPVTVSPETDDEVRQECRDLVARIDEKLKATKDAYADGYADGFVDGLSRALDES